MSHTADVCCLISLSVRPFPWSSKRRWKFARSFFTREMTVAAELFEKAAAQGHSQANLVLRRQGQCKLEKDPETQHLARSADHTSINNLAACIGRSFSPVKPQRLPDSISSDNINKQTWYCGGRGNAAMIRRCDLIVRTLAKTTTYHSAYQTHPNHGR